MFGRLARAKKAVATWRSVVGATFAGAALMSAACSTTNLIYRDDNMDFGQITRVAVMPLANLTQTDAAAERVRDVVANMLLATGAFYVVPHGEVARAIAVGKVEDPRAPTTDNIVRIGEAIKVDAVITGVVKEYGELRASQAAANVISMTLQMHETQSGLTVWAASTTQGGIGVYERLLGGGGVPMNKVTVEAVDALLDALFEQ